MTSTEQQLTRLLGGWAAGSVLLGAGCFMSRRTRGFGRQTLVWGLVDGAIAYAGVRSRARKGPTDPARLRRVLLVNAGLDVGYLATGIRLARSRRWRGDGQAIAVQGAFLLMVDSVAVWALSSDR